MSFVHELIAIGACLLRSHPVRLADSPAHRFDDFRIAIRLTPTTLHLLQRICWFTFGFVVTNMADSDYEPPGKSKRVESPTLVVDDKDLYDTYRRSGKSFIQFSESE